MVAASHERVSADQIPAVSIQKALKGHCAIKITKFDLPYVHIILPNPGKYTTELDKKIM